MKIKMQCTMLVKVRVQRYPVSPDDSFKDLLRMIP
jgi:hypothetical protein